MQNVFLDGLDRRLWLKGNGLPRTKPPKADRTQNKASQVFPNSRVFLRTGLILNDAIGQITLAGFDSIHSKETETC